MSQTNRKPRHLAALPLILVPLTMAGTGALYGQPVHSAPASGRWDASFGADALNGVVYALEVYNGELYAAGNFTDAAGAAVSSIARWDGRQWRDVGGGVLLDDDPGTIHDLAVYGDSSGIYLFAVGEFDTAGGVPANQVARWDGTTWIDFSSGFPPDLSLVDELGVVGGTEAPGLYTTGVSFGYACGGILFRWNGSSWLPVLLSYPENTGIDSADDGSGETVFVGGPYFGCGGSPDYGGSVKWDDGWQGLQSIFQPERFLNYLDKVYGCGITVYDDADIEWFGPVETWDGTIWEKIPTYAYGTPANCFDLQVFDDCSGDNLFVGGADLSPTGFAHNGIFKLNGTTWRSLGSGIPSGTVYALETFEGDLYVAGQFSIAGGNAVENIARWNHCN